MRIQTDSNSTGSNSKRESLLPEPEPLVLDYFLNSDEPQSPSEYPNVFDESKDMLLSAILMYGVIDLRTLAKRGLLMADVNTHTNDDECNKLLQLPISTKDVVRLLVRHRHQIETHIGRESTDLYLDAFDAIQSNSSSLELELEFRRGKVALVDFTVCVVEDDNVERELVYAICVDTARRRITVLFRGCATRKDWTIAANNILRDHPNPLCCFYKSADNDSDEESKNNNDNNIDNIIDELQQPERVALHSGYFNYLFNASQQANGISKFEEIMTHLQGLQQEYPGYQIYVTGHSLGAALATVFSFQAAATRRSCQEGTTDNNYSAITCINFASPMVGNLAFETAFRQLESQGRIRCLRVTNHFDIFTQLPDRGNWLYVMACCAGFHIIAYVGWSLFFFLFFQKHVYRHVGMDLHMYKQGRASNYLFGDKKNMNHKKTPKYSYKVKHSRGTPDSFAWRVALDWKKHFKQAIQRLLMVPFVFDYNTNHSVQEHLLRLTGLSNELENVYLEDLYQGVKTSMTSPTTSPLAGADCGCFA